MINQPSNLLEYLLNRHAMKCQPTSDCGILRFFTVLILSVICHQAHSQCESPPAGMVDWWPGNANALDIVAGNNGTLANGVTYATGEVGQCFNLNSDSAMVLVGNPASLQLQNFTIEAWIQRGSTTAVTSDPYAADGAVLFGYGHYGYAFSLGDNGALYLSQVDSGGIFGNVAITDENWHHVAVTASNGTVTFYIDGVAESVGSYNPNYQFITSAAIGGRSDNINAGNNDSFLGSIDEVSVYSRALSGGEIQSIYNSGAAGKCDGNLPPIIVAQPVSTTVSTGSSPTLTISVAGAPPTGYQWYFNGQPLAYGTNATLTLANFSSANVGSYYVTVTAASGSVTSQVFTMSSVDIHLLASVYVDGLLGSNYLIQATTNLASGWNTLTNVALPSQPYIFIDYASVTNPQAFYRAVPQ